ncbi:MAG TPA: hypothetical protein DD667_24190, partial [Gammaproteobacteria bacterium]|nr:hypothetical protein [Gammaproteobacteria bacterium]
MNTAAHFLTQFVFLVLLQTASAVCFAATTERPDQETRLLLQQTITKANSFKDRFDAEVWLVDMV